MSSKASTRPVWHGASKDLAQLYKRLSQLGCTLRRTGGNHIEVRFPDGTRKSYPTSSTNLHILADLRKEVRRLVELAAAKDPLSEPRPDMSEMVADGLLPPPATPLPLNHPETAKGLTDYLQGPGKVFAAEQGITPEQLKRIGKAAEEAIHINEETEEAPVAMAETTQHTPQFHKGASAKVFQVFQDHPGTIFNGETMVQELIRRGAFYEGSTPYTVTQAVRAMNVLVNSPIHQGVSRVEGTRGKYVYHRPTGAGIGQHEVTAPTPLEQEPEAKLAQVTPINPPVEPHPLHPSVSQPEPRGITGLSVLQPSSDQPKELLLQVVLEDDEKGYLALDVETKLTYWVRRA